LLIKIQRINKRWNQREENRTVPNAKDKMSLVIMDIVK